MAKQNGQHEKWLLPTSFGLSVLAGLYSFLLFPKDTKTVFFHYISYFIVALIVILATSLTIMIYKKQQRKILRLMNEEARKREKTIEQIIWRNRYVLQSRKSKFVLDESSKDNENWQDEKMIFAKKYIFPVIREGEVTFEIISELIEKSLSGAAIGGIRPPTYMVRDAHQ